MTLNFFFYLFITIDNHLYGGILLYIFKMLGMYNNIANYKKDAHLLKDLITKNLKYIQINLQDAHINNIVDCYVIMEL